MSHNEKTITKVENLRLVISSQWWKVIKMSGAIVLKHPRFSSCFKGLIFLLAKEYNVLLS